MIRVANISFSSQGGAGGVAKILGESLRLQGCDVIDIFQIETSLRTAQRPLLIARKATALFDEAIVKRRGVSSQLSLARDLHESSVNYENLKDRILHFHWLNGLTGFGLRNLALLDQPIVWTFHDLNPVTGACHSPGNCIKFTSGCDSCPLARRPFHHLIAKNKRLKDSILRGLGNLTVVSPSKWQAREVETSLGSGDIRVIHIPNPVSQPFLTLPTSKRIVPGEFLRFGFMANHLGDPNKGLASVIKVLRNFQETQTLQFVLSTMGNDSPVVLQKQPFTHIGRSYSKNPMEVIEFLDSLDVLVTGSESENSPQVIKEACARGIPVLYKSSVGAKELGDSLNSELVLEWDSASQFSEGVRRIVDILHSDGDHVFRLNQAGRNLFGPDEFSRRHTMLYQAIS